MSGHPVDHLGDIVHTTVGIDVVHVQEVIGALLKILEAVVRHMLADARPTSNDLALRIDVAGGDEELREPIVARRIPGEVDGGAGYAGDLQVGGCVIFAAGDRLRAHLHEHGAAPDRTVFVNGHHAVHVGLVGTQTAVRPDGAGRVGVLHMHQQILLPLAGTPPENLVSRDGAAGLRSLPFERDGAGGDLCGAEVGGTIGGGQQIRRRDPEGAADQRKDSREQKNPA